MHNNGGTQRHAIWLYIHYGDQYESVNRELTSRLIKAISAATLDEKSKLEKELEIN